MNAASTSITIPIGVAIALFGILITSIITWAAYTTKQMLQLVSALEVVNTQIGHVTEQVTRLTEQVRQLELEHPGWATAELHRRLLRGDED